jgi:hypothetical protein
LVWGDKKCITVVEDRAWKNKEVVNTFKVVLREIDF